ncbi:MAG: hypothetical protein AAFX87_27415 [Bacteroidota bacterium]
MKYSSKNIKSMMDHIKPDALAESNWSPSNVSPSWASPSICSEDSSPFCEDRYPED